MGWPIYEPHGDGYLLKRPFAGKTERYAFLTIR